MIITIFSGPDLPPHSAPCCAVEKVGLAGCSSIDISCFIIPCLLMIDLYTNYIQLTFKDWSICDWNLNFLLFKTYFTSGSSVFVALIFTEISPSHSLGTAYFRSEIQNDVRIRKSGLGNGSTSVQLFTLKYFVSWFLPSRVWKHEKILY